VTDVLRNNIIENDARQGKLKGFIHVLNLNFPLDLGGPVLLANEKATVQAMLLEIFGYYA